MSRLSALARFSALPALAGVFYFLSWIGFGAWPLALFCFVPFVWAIRADAPRTALKRGLVFGLVTHVGGYTWLVHLFSVFAAAPLPLAILGMLVTCAGQGAILGVFAWVLRRLWLGTRLPLTLLLPLALVATEHVYPLVFQSYTGVSLLPVTPLVQIADLGGVLLLSALQGMVNGALADALLFWRAPEPRRPHAPLASLVTSALLCAAASGYGLWRLDRIEKLERGAKKLRIGLSQPNIGGFELHSSPQEGVKVLRDHTAELHGRAADLVVWPEVAFNTFAVDLSRPGVGEFLRQGVPVDLIAGALRVEAPGPRDRFRRVFNSALMIDRKGSITGHFDKIALLAFGEYIPLGETFPFLYKWSPLAAPFTRGTTLEPLRARGARFAAFICYEAILPGLVHDLMHATPEGRPHVLVNLTNDSWYGTGLEQEQHLQLAAIRSLEHRRWMVRATSTGISAFIDARGMVVQRLARDTRGVMVRDVPLLEETTLYTRVGNWPGWLSLAAVVLLLARGWKRASA